MVKWTNAELIEATVNSTSVYGILRYMGLKINGNSHKKIKECVKELNLDTSHFTGKGWCRGDKYEEFVQNFVEYPLEKILIKNSNYHNANGLKKKLLKAGLLDYKCYKCDMTEWQGEPITLHLHHINGDRTDNNIDNLTILCPNCHSQTPNYAGKNSKKKHKIEPMNKKMNFRTENSLFIKFQKECEKNYKSVSEVIRQLMKEYVQES